MIETKGKFGGIFTLEHYRARDPETHKQFRDTKGRFERRLLGVSTGHNLWTTEGLNRINDVFFHGTTQTATWYCALSESNTSPTAAMNYDVPVYTESTSYDEAARPAYDEAASAAGVTTNAASKAVFTISATKTIYGASLVSLSTKGDHTGGANNVLACYSLIDPSRSVIDNDVINLTYQITSADDAV